MTTTTGNGLPGLGRVPIWFNDPQNWQGPDGLLAYISEHVAYAVVIVAAALAIALPLGLLVGHTGRGSAVVAGVANALRAVPPLGLLLLLIELISPHLHIASGLTYLIAQGSVPYFIPAMAVLLVLAVSPILASTYAGVQSVDPAARDAARGMGMRPVQVVTRVEAPCALPLILSGIRSATLQVIATLAVAAYAPLVGGLGRLIIDGDQDLTSLQHGYPAMVAAGITVAVLALTADGLLALLQRLVVSRGITGRYPARPAGRSTRRRIMKNIRLLPAALLGLATALAACGAPGSSARPGGPSADRAGPPAAPPAALPSSPGSVTIGSADFPEDEILAYIYGDAMKARGVTVSVHADIGERPAYISALRDGSIGAIPEYSGSILDYLDPSATAKVPVAVYTELRQVAAAQGFAVTSYAPAQDIDTITVTKATAARYHLTTIASLKNVAGQLSLGAPEPLLTLPYGVPALRRVYGVVFQRFVPLPAGGTVTQTALRDGTIGAADIFSTDPSVTRYRFVPLTDTKHIFAAQNVVPLFRQSVLTQPMARACNAVSARLTTASLRNLAGEVADGASPASAAARWLARAGLG